MTFVAIDTLADMIEALEREGYMVIAQAGPTAAQWETLTYHTPHNPPDERAEIARLGSLLDDAVDLLVAWLPAKDDPLLEEQTVHFLGHPEVESIMRALNKANWKRPPLICPACGADYAEAEAKNERFAQIKPVKRCDRCNRDHCDCYDKDCVKCHWTGSANCNRAALPEHDKGDE